MCTARKVDGKCSQPHKTDDSQRASSTAEWQHQQTARKLYSSISTATTNKSTNGSATDPYVPIQCHQHEPTNSSSDILYPNKLRRRCRRGKPMKTNIKLLYANVRGLKRKTASLYDNIQSYQPQIVCLVETMFGAHDNLAVPGYKTIQLNRVSKPGGGIMMLLANQYANTCRDATVSGCRLVWLLGSVRLFFGFKSSRTS